MLVTTGGQQVIDLVCKTLIDPGDVVVAEAPTYPGAVPVFISYQADVVQIEMDADGMRVDLLEETLDRLDREGRRPKFIYTVPTFQNPAGVTMSLRAPPAAGARSRTSASCSCSRTTRTGCCATRASRCRRCYSLDGGEYVIYLGTFSKILSPGHPARLGGGAAAGAREDQPRQAGRRPVHVDAVAADRRRRTSREGDWRDYVELARARSTARRRDTMLDALAEHFPPRGEWTRPGGGLFIWATLPDFIDTTDLLARALRENVAFVPGRGGVPGRPRRAARCG